MKDIIFNELSEYPLSDDLTEAFRRIEKFALTYKQIPDSIFNKGIRLDSSKEISSIFLMPKLTLRDFIKQSQGRQRTLLSFLLGIGRYPYFDNDDIEEEYLSKSYTISQNNEAKSAIGLAAAYLQNTIGISFESEEYWQTCVYDLHIEDEESSQNVQVLSVSTPDHFEEHALKEWLNEHSDIELIKTDIEPQNKEIHFRDDHGTDLLMAFARKIIKSPYVVGIVNSCSFSPHNRNFVRNVSDDGILEITLSWTDRGLGMAIRTTGRNLRETRMIAEIIREKYGK